MNLVAGLRIPWEYTKTSKSIRRPALDQSDFNTAGPAPILIERDIIIEIIAQQVTIDRTPKRNMSTKVRGKRFSVENQFVLIRKPKTCRQLFSCIEKGVLKSRKQ